MKTSGAWHWLKRFSRSRRGNVSVMVAILIIPLVGILGTATEAGNWYAIQRSEQNAADSAVLAAAQNGIHNPSGTTYISEAGTVATNFGYTNSVNNTTVTTLNNQTCPAPATGSACYKVTISRNVPLSMLKVLGYSGTGGSGNQAVAASSIAGLVNAVTNYCILSLSTTGQGIVVHGGPNVDFTGCNLMSDSTLNGNGSNTATNCTGQNPHALAISAAGYADPNCGSMAHSSAPSIPDPYASLVATGTPNATDIADTTCGGTYGGVSWNSSTAFTSVTKVCGNVTLSGDVTIPSGTVVVIQNGQLDLNNHALTGSGVSLVFNTTATGANIAPFASGGGSTGKGTLTISAPQTGNWHGVAIFQNRQNGSPTILPQTYDGSHPTWNVTGLVYMPKIELTFSGAVGADGYNCFVLIANTLLINGNGSIYQNPISQCLQAGVAPPSNIVSSRIALVQ